MKLITEVKRAARWLLAAIILSVFGWCNRSKLFGKLRAVTTKRRIDFVGLFNQGATCYLNTLLQTWFMTPEVKDYLDSLKTDVAFVCELQSLFKRLESRKERSVRTYGLTRSLRLNVFQQCDIEECFRNLINKLTFEVDKEQNILKLYQIIMVQSMKCSKCTNLFEDDCSFLDIPLPIRSGYSSAKVGNLETAIQEFLKKDTMKGDNECYCDHCSTKTETDARYYFKQLPQILTFQLKRFEVVNYGMYYQKCHDCITIPLNLEFNKTQDNCNEWCLKPTMDKENNAHNNHQSQATGRGQPSKIQDPEEADRTVGDDEDQAQQDSTEEKEKLYELFAIWHHSGEYGCGHYWADIKSGDNWYCFNDNTVKKITAFGRRGIVPRYLQEPQDSVSSNTAYLIMYRDKQHDRISSTEKKVEAEVNSHRKVLPTGECSHDILKHLRADTEPPDRNINQNMCSLTHRTDRPSIYTQDVGSSQHPQELNRTVEDPFSGTPV